MTYFVPPGFARVQVDYGGGGALGSVPTFGFGVSTVPTLELCDVVSNWWIDSLKARTSNAYNLTRVRAYSDTLGVELPSYSAGSYSGAIAPPNVAALCSMGTEIRGRKFRGRFYIPGCLADSEVNDDGSLSSGAIGAIQGVCDNLVAALGEIGAGVGLVVLHSSETAPTEVISLTAQGVAATVRRRLRK